MRNGSLPASFHYNGTSALAPFEEVAFVKERRAGTKPDQ